MPVKRSVINWNLFIALAWLALVGYQLVRSMWIDAYGLTQSQFDLLGYWVAFVLSSIMGLRLLHLRRMMLPPVLLVLLLISYITLIRIFTAPSQSPISFLFSRYGILMWFVLGVGLAAVLDILQKIHFRPGEKWARRAVLTIICCLSVPALNFAHEIILSPVWTLSYQGVASSITIYLLMLACTLIVVWGQSLSLTLTFAYIVIATVLVSAATLLQSTSMVAFWLGLIAVFIHMKIRYSRTTGKFMVALLTILGLIAFTASEFFETIITETRFSVFLTRADDFTSVTSRLDILGTFWDQFAISPILGHFEAEKASGVGEGNYMHSLPLSFLTHTGLIGTGIAAMILVILFHSRRSTRPGLDPSESLLKLVMWLVLALGTISTFMTWSVFWFMLGCLCRRPAINTRKD